MCGPGPLLEPMLVVWGRSWDQCWRSWAALGPLLAVLARAWGHCVPSWAALGAYVGGLDPLLVPILAVLGHSWALCWRSWAALGPYVRGLGPLLGLCWRSRAALRASVRDLGRSWGLMLAVLGGLGPKSGPNLSGNRVGGRKVAQTRAGAGSQRARAPRNIRGIWCLYPFFL